MNSIVSVIIVTYNSSAFIEETLESVAEQSWKGIELIITDDCSDDNTIELCQEWLNKNGKRFIRTQIITVPVNTGIAANCNRGLKEARGEWIKYCAGDDALMPDCIKDNMHFITDHPEVKVLFSCVRAYKETFNEMNYIRTIPGQYPDHIINDNITAGQQFRLLLLSDRINFTPASFINRAAQIQVGGFCEKAKLQEDYPMWLSLTKAGIKLNFMDKETVKYRKHLNATNNTLADYLIEPVYFVSEDFRREFVYPELPHDIKWREQFKWYSSQFYRLKWLNKNKRPYRLLLRLFTTYLNPFCYYIFFKKRLNKHLKSNEFYM